MHVTPLFGLSSYTYPWSIGLAKRAHIQPMQIVLLLEAAVALDAKRIQLADNFPVHELSRQAWNDLISEARASQIQLELGIRGLTRDNLEAYLSLCTDCQSPFLRVVIDAADYEPPTDTIIEIINSVLPQFRKQKILLALENHDRFRAGELVEIIRATDPDWVGICLDTANSLGADEGIYEVTETLAPYTVNLHVKDYAIRRFSHGMGFEVTGRPAGTGQAPIPWILERLAKFGNCQSATLEVWTMPLETAELTIVQEQQWAASGAEYLKSALAARQAEKINT